MSKLLLGTLAGLIFAILDVLIMIPIEFEDKKSALLGAFINRFSIGFVLGATELSIPLWASGIGFGLLLSLPDAIITKAWIPILAIGAIGGGLIGIAINLWAI
jgi:hypothetical protein